MDRKRGGGSEREAVRSVEMELEIRDVSCVECGCELYRTIIGLKDLLRRNRERLRLIMSVGLGLVGRVCLGGRGVGF